MLLKKILEFRYFMLNLDLHYQNLTYKTLFSFSFVINKYHALIKNELKRK
jgi:hypothetical protein